jgi:hypothetical protein
MNDMFVRSLARIGMGLLVVFITPYFFHSVLWGAGVGWIAGSFVYTALPIRG